jgi:hypothetical protein
LCCFFLLFCFSKSCVASFSGLSIFDCPIGILWRLFTITEIFKKAVLKNHNSTWYLFTIFLFLGFKKVRGKYTSVQQYLYGIRWLLGWRFTETPDDSFWSYWSKYVCYQMIASEAMKDYESVNKLLCMLQVIQLCEKGHKHIHHIIV